MNITAQEIKDLTGQDFPQSMIDAWVGDLELLAEDCIKNLSPEKQRAAIRYLLAHFLTLQGADGQGQMQSESFGDASYTFWTGDKGAGSRATRFGSMARTLAPCLGRIMGDKVYGGARLIR